MSSHDSPPKLKTTERWQKVARRIRVPLGFLTAALYLFELWRREPRLAAVAWSLLLVLPGLWLRAYASGYVKKNRELTQTGPYAYTRNPLYLGSILIAAGFAVALLSWPVAAMLAAMFLIIYVPVIASEERFLRTNFPDFDAYSPSSPATDSAAYPCRSAHRPNRSFVGQVLCCSLFKAPRVQCIYRSRPALPQPALPPASCWACF